MNSRLSNEKLDIIWNESFSSTKTPDENFLIFDQKYEASEHADQIQTMLFSNIVNILDYGRYEYPVNAFQRDSFVTSYKKNIYRLDKTEHPFYWAFNGLLNNDKAAMKKYVVEYLDKLLRLWHEGDIDMQDAEAEFVWDFFIPFKNGYRYFWNDFLQAMEQRKMPEECQLWRDSARLLSSFYDSYSSTKGSGIDKRVKTLKDFISRFPDLTFPKELLGWISFDNKDYQTAMQYWEENTENAILLSQAERYWKMAWLYFHLKDYEKEEKYYRLYWEICPEDVYIRNNLGWCLYNQGRYDEAEELFIESMKREESLSYAPKNYFSLLVKNGRAEEARDFANSGKYKIPKALMNRLEKLEEKIQTGKKTNQTKNRNKMQRKYDNQMTDSTHNIHLSTERTTETDMDDFIEVTSNGTVSARNGVNNRTPYDHQKDAMKCMDIIDHEDTFSTLVVLPTGGGKTYTASTWLLRHALNRHKKILWLAHRQMLLDQAAESFQKFAYKEMMPNITSFQYRIVSGSTNHDRAIDITPSDDLLIVSKDSMGRNLDKLDAWLDGEEEIYLVVDEAHHSTAKTYRRIIDHVKSKVKLTKIIGLTATPFRTAETEQGLLSKIYSDGVENGMPVRNRLGIAYKIGLKELINRGILSKPIFESCYTDTNFGADMGVDDWESISRLDVIPDRMANQMVEHAARNRLIINTYLKKQDEYGQTIVFAINVPHAISLSKLFNEAGIPAQYVVSNTKDMVTGITRSREENEKNLEEYRKGNLKVLVNVNILTEGVDLPKTKTVFLARPTVSTILMTQMVGRALRGKDAGGTDKAYIVSFVDNWNEHIAWVNPETLFVDENNDFTENDYERQQHQMRMIAISKIEEFASILDKNVNTRDLEMVPFMKRIPVGMYMFSYLLPGGMDRSHQIMVYDSTQKAYEDLMDSLPDLFESFGVQDEEYLDASTQKEMAHQCENTFFTGEMIPPYDEEDIIQLLNFYAQKTSTPKFYTFDFLDKSKLDVTAIAKYICESRMSRMDEAEYIDKLWNETDNNVIKLIFGRKINLDEQIQIEIRKLMGRYEDDGDNVTHGHRKYEDMTLFDIRKVNSDYEKALRDQVFASAKDDKGYYVCAECGKKSKSKIAFHVDHFKPMNKGGKTVPENLQILCRSCNQRKSDHYEE